MKDIKKEKGRKKETETGVMQFYNDNYVNENNDNKNVHQCNFFFL